MKGRVRRRIAPHAFFLPAGALTYLLIRLVLSDDWTSFLIAFTVVTDLGPGEAVWSDLPADRSQRRNVLLARLLPWAAWIAIALVALYGMKLVLPMRWDTWWWILWISVMLSLVILSGPLAGWWSRSWEDSARR